MRSQEPACSKASHMSQSTDAMPDLSRGDWPQNSSRHDAIRVAQTPLTTNRFAPPKPAPMAPNTIRANVDEMLREMSLQLPVWMKAAASKGIPAPITNAAIDARLACRQKT